MLTQERLKEVYLYDPETGDFTRLEATRSHGGKADVGKVGGSRSGERYIRIGIDGRVYRAHRLAWLYMTGEWPKDGVDHIDLDGSNNRWLNLREADQSQNGANTRRRKDNMTGFKGVSRTPQGNWQACVWVKQKKHYLGTFATAPEAFAAYQTAAGNHFGAFSRTA